VREYALLRHAVWNFELPALLVRAIALFQLGRRHEARTALDKASELYRARVAKPTGSALGGEWHDRVIAEVLRREAEAMLLDSTFPVKPFAPRANRRPGQSHPCSKLVSGQNLAAGPGRECLKDGETFQ
jgi:hypothetical protein